MKIRILTLLLVAVLLLAGCNNQGDSGEKAAQTTQTHKHEQNATAPSFTGFDGVISDHEAKQIALEQAGIASEEELTFFIMALEYDDGLAVYEIDFTHNGIEYEYDIDAKTGQILERDRDRDENSKQDKDTSGTTQDVIGEAEAKRIALEHAGVTEEELTFFNMALEYDDGRAVYEIDFTQKGIEYEYDIDAYTGEILSHEQDRDD